MKAGRVAKIPFRAAALCRALHRSVIERKNCAVLTLPNAFDGETARVVADAVATGLKAAAEKK